MRGKHKLMAGWRVTTVLGGAISLFAAHLSIAPTVQAVTEMSLLFADARAIAAELHTKAEAASSTGPLGKVLADRAWAVSGYLTDVERPAYEGQPGVAATTAGRLLGTLNDIENAALHLSFTADDADHVRRALDIETTALRLDALVVSITERLVAAHHEDRTTPDAPTIDLALRADALRDALAAGAEAASPAAQPSSSADEILAARDAAVAVGTRTWSRSLAMHQATFALAASPTGARTDLCDPTAGEACVQGWAEEGTDPRVAAVLQALGESDQATADLYHDTFYAFLPPRVAAALDQAIAAEGDALATVGSAIDSLNVNESAETTAKTNGRDRNGDCCATSPYRWERSGILYFYYCYQQCSYPAGMRFELATTLVNFSAVPYDGYFTHYYGPSIYISRYEVPMREDIASNPDKTKAWYSCGTGSLSLSCSDTRTSPTVRGHYYFNETRLTARPAGYPDRTMKWQTRRWVPYSATQADFPAYRSGG